MYSSARRDILGRQYQSFLRVECTICVLIRGYVGVSEGLGTRT
jgi:hypothetical protein